MRIILFVSSLGFGGAERVATLLSAEWARRGHKVTIVQTYTGEEGASIDVSKHVEKVAIGDLFHRRRFVLLDRILKYLSIRSYLSDRLKEGPDIVIVSFLTNVNISVLMATIGLNLNIIVSERTYPPNARIGFLLNAMRRVFYPRASCVVVQTKDCFKWLKDTIPEVRGVVIPNPVVVPVSRSTPELFPSDFIDLDANRMVLAVGRLDSDKQFDYLIEAFSLLNAREVGACVLVIVGEGPLRSYLENLASEYKIQDRVQFVGKVGNISDWYNAADLFVSTSRLEGYPNGLLEAMAHGLCACCLDCKTGPSDLILHEVNGVLLPQDSSTKVFSTWIGRLMSDDSLRGRYASQAKQVATKHSVSRISKSWEELF